MRAVWWVCCWLVVLLPNLADGRGVNVTVVDAVSGQPLQGALVDVVGFGVYSVLASGVTDAQGRYESPRELLGIVKVIVRPPGYLAYNAETTGDAVVCPPPVHSAFRCWISPGSFIQPADQNLLVRAARGGQLRVALQAAPGRALSNTEIFLGPSASIPPRFPAPDGVAFIDHWPTGHYQFFACSSDHVCTSPDGIEMDGFGTSGEAASVEIVAGQETVIESWQLSPGAEIRVSLAIPDLAYLSFVSVFLAKGDQLAIFGSVDGDRRQYRIDRLRAGSYRVRTGPDSNWNPVWYAGPDCQPPQCQASEGSILELAAGQRLTLPTVYAWPARTIRGRVTSASGVALAGIRVVPARWSWAGFGGEGEARSDANGYYELLGLENRPYVVLAGGDRRPPWWITERYPETRCSPIDRAQCLPVNQHNVDFSSTANVSGINFSLESGGAISGKVSFPAMEGGSSEFTLLIWPAGGPQPNVARDYWRVGPAWVSEPLPAGAYHVAAERWNGSAMIAKIWPNALCPHGVESCDWRLGASVSVSSGILTSGIEFSLPELFASGFE